MGRSRFISSQIDDMLQTESFTADGLTTDFVLLSNIYYSSGFDPLGSSEITVWVNGVRAPKGGEAGAEYTLSTTGTDIDTVVFSVAPLGGDNIAVEYRPKE